MYGALLKESCAHCGHSFGQHSYRFGQHDCCEFGCTCAAFVMPASAGAPCTACGERCDHLSFEWADFVMTKDCDDCGHTFGLHNGVPNEHGCVAHGCRCGRFEGLVVVVAAVEDSEYVW